MMPKEVIAALERLDFFDEPIYSVSVHNDGIVVTFTAGAYAIPNGKPIEYWDLRLSTKSDPQGVVKKRTPPHI